MSNALHKDASELELKDFPEKHAGLHFEKYFDSWTPEDNYQTWKIGNDSEEKSSEKLAWLNGYITDQKHDADLLEKFLKRQEALLAKRNGLSKTFTSNAPFVTGLGRNHPLENGFLWHHTLAVPYLPGSSVKGMTRAYLEHWSDHSVDIDKLFGSATDNDENKNSQVGNIIFMDAIAESFSLKADIINPHYSEYYQGKKDAGNNLIPPADYLKPIPTFFLVIEKAKFRFAVLPRNVEAQDDAEKVLCYIAEALDMLGAGAKTAVGYGRFTVV